MNGKQCKKVRRVARAMTRANPDRNLVTVQGRKGDTAFHADGTTRSVYQKLKASFKRLPKNYRHLPPLHG